MIQSILLSLMVILCILLLISIMKNPLEINKTFKFLKPKIVKNKNKRLALIEILIDKQFKYFINFPLLLKLYSNKPFKANIIISYFLNYDDKKEILLNKSFEFKEDLLEQELFLTDVIYEKILIELEADIIFGNPIICIEIKENNLFPITDNSKIEIKL